MELLRKQRYMYAFFIAVYLLLSVYAVIIFPMGSLWASDNRPQDRPYVYRVFMPAMAGALRAAMPEQVKEKLTSDLIYLRGTGFITYFYRIPGDEAKWPAGLLDKNILDTGCKLFAVWLSILVFCNMMYVLTRAALPDSLSYALFAPVVSLLLIAPFEISHVYTYDFAELAFSCACLYLLFQERWRAYLLCFAVATLNKETTIFIGLLYCIWFFPRLPRQRFILLGIAQLLIFACIKGALTWYFAHHRGVLLESYYIPDRYYGYSYTDFIMMLWVVMLVTYRWQEKPAFLRAALWMLLPNTIAFFIWGFHNEYRAFYWSMPVPIILGVHTLVSLSGIAKLPIFRPAIAPAQAG